MTLEALVLHMADNLDAKVNIMITAAEKTPDVQHPGWTPCNKPLKRLLYVQALGPDPDTGA